MKIKTSELTESTLNWAVAKCEGISTAEFITLHSLPVSEAAWQYQHSTNWAQGGPIIERAGLHLRKSGCEWQCDYWNDSALNFDTSYGPTALIAAMRRFVASKLGNFIDVPDELIQ